MALLDIFRTALLFSLFTHSLAATNPSSGLTPSRNSTFNVTISSIKFSSAFDITSSSPIPNSVRSNASSLSALSSSTSPAPSSATLAASSGSIYGFTSKTLLSVNPKSSISAVTSSISTIHSSSSKSSIGSQSGFTLPPPSSQSSPVASPGSIIPVPSDSAIPGSSPPDVTPSSTSQNPSTVLMPTPPTDVVITGSLGLISLGLQTSTESGDFSSMQTGIPGLTEHIATQTSRNGHNTILPIWFLSIGIGIIKLPSAGVQVGGIIPPPPGFPPLFIGADGSPTAGGPPEGTKDPQTSSTENSSSDNPTSTTTSSTSDMCTTTTVSSCVQTCTPTSDTQGSQTVSCEEPSCIQTVACSAISTTSTMTLTSPTCTSGCSTCYTYQGDGENPPADDDGNDADGTTIETKRSYSPPSVAGRISLLSKRQKANTRNFITFNDPENPKLADNLYECTLSQTLKIPNYPKPSDLPRKASGGAQFWWVMTEITAPNTCPVLSYNKVTDVALTSQKINPADQNTYQNFGDWTRNTPTANTDHVYELSILKNYFSTRITSKAICDEFKNHFDTPDLGSPIVPGDTRLQTIWRQLPSNTNPEFAGMDAKINKIKAQLFTKVSSDGSDSDTSLGYLNELAVAVKITNDPLISPLFKKTNSRVYAALLGIDTVIDAANCGSASNPVVQGDWASEYKKWMTNLLTTAGTNANNEVSRLLNDDSKLGPSARVGPGSTTGVDGKATATTNSIGSGVAAFLNAYPTPNAFTLNVASLIEFPESSTLNIRRQACSALPSASDSSIAVSSSFIQTSLPLSSTLFSSSEVSTATTSTIPSSVTKSSSVQSSITSPPTEPFCLPDNHPDRSVYQCICSSSITVHGSNVASGQLECPQTSPGTQWKTVSATVTTAAPPFTTFPSTNVVGDVQLCTTTSHANYGGIAETMCIGPTLSTHKPPYATGVCNVHIKEYASIGYVDQTLILDFSATIDVYDGKNGLLHTLDYYGNNTWDRYGTTLTVPKGPLIYDLNVDFLAGAAGVPERRFDVQISSDPGTTWSTKDNDTSKLPHCEVGGWDDKDSEDSQNRQMDCRWQC